MLEHEIRLERLRRNHRTLSAREMALYQIINQPMPDAERFAVLTQKWQDQGFGRRRARRIAGNCDRARWRLVCVAIVMLAAIIAASLYVGKSNAAQLLAPLHLAATLCFFLPALIYVYADFKGLPENVARYERIFSIFARARKLLQELMASSCKVEQDDSAQARRIYRELGREALHENGEWLLLHRERPLDIDA